MKPIHFHKDEQMLKGHGEIGDLPILCRNYGEEIGQGAISCWQLTWKEWFWLFITRKVYLVVLGTFWPPVTVTLDGKDIGAK